MQSQSVQRRFREEVTVIALLIATVREGIDTVFGREAYPAVAERLEELVDRLASQAIQGHVAVLDDRVGMALAGLEPVSSASTVGVVAAVRAYAERQGCDAVLLVGGHQLVPMIRVRNPVSDRSLDPDREVLTDLPYGADGDGISDYVTGPRMVSRLPNPHSRRLDDFLALIDNVACPVPAKSGSTAIVSKEWEAAGRRVAAGMPGPVTFRVAPHYRLDDRHRDDLACRWLYVNLHGYPDKDEWQAFDENASRFLKVMGLCLAGPGERIGRELCRGGRQVPIQGAWRGGSATGVIRPNTGVSATLGTCASNGSNETRRS